MVRLTIPAQHAFRDLVVSAVLAAIDAEGGGPGAEARDEITSALGEAFNNVVLHAYRDIRGGTLDVRANATPTSVEIVLSDRGRSFDPLEIPSYAAPQMDDDAELDDIDLDRVPEGGMGLFIIRSFMDELSYVAGGGGRPNVLVLRKTWPAASLAQRPHVGVAEGPAPSVTRLVVVSPSGDPALATPSDDARETPGNQARRAPAGEPREALPRPAPEASRGASASKKESSRSGWRMRSVAVPSYEQSTAGSLKRK